MKKVLCLIMALSLVFVLAACGGTTAESTAPADASAAPAESAVEGEATIEGDSIMIGGLAPLTGDVSFYGIGVKQGAEIAVAEINANGGILGKELVYNVLDEKGDPTEAVQAYNQLMDEGMIALMGDVTTAPTIAVAQKAAQDGIPMITPTATGAAVTETGENIFRICFTDPFQGTLLADYAFNVLEAETAAVLYDTGDDYSAGVAAAFEEKAAELGLEIVASEGYPTGNTDYNAQLTKIKQDEPDVILASGYYSDAALITTQARDLGIESVFMGPDGWDGVLGQVGDNTSVLEGYYYCSQYSSENPSEALQGFMDSYQEAYGEEENMFAVLGYESIYALAYAIEDAGSVDYDAVNAALTNLEFDGLTGAISFQGGRDPVRDAFIVQFQDGMEVVLGTHSMK